MLITLLFTVAALAGFPAAPKAEHRVSQWDLDGADLCFASGLHVVAVRRSGGGVVHVTSVVEGGLAAEGPERAGAVWAIAGLRPWSTPLDAGPLAISGLGTTSRVTVQHEALVVHTAAPADQLGDVIRRETAWLADPLAGIDEATLDAARPHLEARAWDGMDDGQLAGTHQLRRQLYPDAHPGQAFALPGPSRWTPCVTTSTRCIARPA